MWDQGLVACVDWSGICRWRHVRYFHFLNWFLHVLCALTSVRSVQHTVGTQEVFVE